MHDRETSTRIGGRRRCIVRCASLALLVIVGLLAAGCGNDSPSAGGGTSAGGSGRGDAMIAYARCMRAHGVPDFPDPQRVSGGWRLAITQAMMESPKFESAKQACRSNEPGAGGTATVSAQERERALKFADCMRSHGVPNFPDPTFENGNVTFKQDEGVDASSPAYQQASQQCARFGAGGGGG